MRKTVYGCLAALMCNNLLISTIAIVVLMVCFSLVVIDEREKRRHQTEEL